MFTIKKLKLFISITLDYLKKFENLKVRLDVIKAFVKISIHKNILLVYFN